MARVLCEDMESFISIKLDKKNNLLKTPERRERIREALDTTKELLSRADKLLSTFVLSYRQLEKIQDKKRQIELLKDGILCFIDLNRK